MVGPLPAPLVCAHNFVMDVGSMQFCHREALDTLSISFLLKAPQQRYALFASLVVSQVFLVMLICCLMQFRNSLHTLLVLIHVSV